MCKSSVKDKIEEQEFFCPECGENDFDVREYNDGRTKRVEIVCVTCGWEVDE